MKRRKWIISLWICMLLSATSFAQQSSNVYEIESLSREIFSFVTSLNENIDNYFQSEKKKKLRRLLGYFQNDLRKYLVIRKKLMDDLASNNYSTTNDDTKKMVSKLKFRLNKLSTRLLNISYLLHEELSFDAEDIVNRIYQAQQSQRAIYLTDLEKLLNGQYVDKEKLTESGEKIYAELNEAVGLITTIKKKLKDT